MWKCHKCGKPVYFAERKQSLGYDWHPECLRCEECGKRLNPGQHAEHKGVPYCHVPCYGALFGPQLFGHGTRVESHKSFGGRKLSPRVNSGPQFPRSHLESKLKVFNQFYDGRAGEVRSREVNGRLVLEGALRIHWGVRGLIHLKEDDDQRTVVTVRKRNSCRMSASLTYDTDDLSDENNTSNDVVDNKCDNSLNSGNETMVDDAGDKISELTLDEPVVESAIAVPTDNSNEMTDLSSCPKSLTLPDKLDVRNFDWDELDDLLQVERRVDDSDKLYQTMPVPLHSVTSHSSFDKSNITTPNTPLSLSNQSSLESPTSDTNITDSVQTNESSQQSAEISETQQTIGALQTNDFNQQNGTMRRIKNYEKTLEECNDKTLVPSKMEKENINRTISQDDSWIEKGLNRSMSGPDCLERGRRADSDSDNDDSSVQDTVSQPIDTDYQRDQSKPRTGSTAIRRRPGARRSRTKLKRRCSINGHFYDRETSIFTPPHGSQMSVWVTSLVSTPEVINLILEKYKVDSLADNFALFVVRDNGEQRRLRDDEYPLLARVLLGPHEDVAKLFLFDRHSQNEVSNEVAQFLNLSLAECRAILQQYSMQEMKEVQSILARYEEMKKRIKQRMEDLKVRL